MAKGITKRSEDYSKWYLDIVKQAELAENSSVRGAMVIKPYGYAIWENFQKVLDKKFKELGHVNAYFPLLIPKSLLSKEAKHVDGFAQESAIVTHYRLKVDKKTKEVIVDPEAKLAEELIVRPTSETIIYDTYSRWIESWRDLPLLINQWVNVVRWEMRPRPFLRTSEFLWQEGHTAHATHKEAEEEALRMLDVYKEFAEEYLAIPVISGEKSESERFPGADHTYTIEAMMQDGKALQSGTSHDLGQNFSKAFDIKFANKDGKEELVWQTSWGLSTRMIGALIMQHSDDSGLILPPKIAPVQIVIIPIWKTDKEKSEVLEYANNVLNSLKDKSVVKLDDRDYETPGYKFNEWEKKGVPIRIEIGPRDIKSNEVVVVRRDTSEKKSKKLDEIEKAIPKLLDDIQKSLFKKAKKFLKDNTHQVNTYDEFKDVIEKKHGFALAHWDGTKETEEKIQKETKATIRCIPFDMKKEKGKDIVTGKESEGRVVFGKAY
ncbi:MAG TPA: proline--tRNA ligase [bacterium]|nr:proline--tRNA ligase [bacterium]